MADVDHRLVEPDADSKSEQRIYVSNGLCVMRRGLNEAEKLDPLLAASSDGLHQLKSIGGLEHVSEKQFDEADIP